ncbi:GntR family transcriptional regulator [Aquibaculum arenosum]|uniref:GntR family transcriptional regulator n=1 Tax=Aquibaculum arenosum TaxID=3032591 RepID=A0ABT5YPH8_9PROT|nr:GntR family transcriptional regulator [Fodinicurvata sp. CAU 1616]MDF2096876.1 GntR family transcriptional regulator [Fodinicurvata sp. CAU 1616]
MTDSPLYASDMRRPLSLAEQIANHVAEMVLKEEYRPGENIPEVRLASYFQVSRGPVREALRILEKEGVVTINPRRGAQVTKLSVDEVSEVFVIRATLFGLAARLFAQFHKPETLDRLERLLAEMKREVEAGGDLGTHVQLSRDMADLILEHCGNRRLRDMVTQLARQILRYTRLGLASETRRRQSLSSWQTMVEAIAVRNGQKAERTAAQMVTNSQEHAMRMLALQSPDE